MKEAIRKALQALFLEEIEDIKIRDKDIAIELGLSVRAVTKMKVENSERYTRMIDFLKFKQIMNDEDVRIIKKGDYYRLYKDDDWIDTLDDVESTKLTKKEKRNLARLGETTISNKEYIKELLNAKKNNC